MSHLALSIERTALRLIEWCQYAVTGRVIKNCHSLYNSCVATHRHVEMPWSLIYYSPILKSDIKPNNISFFLCLILPEALYSATPEAIAQYTAQRLRCHTIVDGFCGAGGNTIQFAKICMKGGLIWNWLSKHSYGVQLTLFTIISFSVLC